MDEKKIASFIVNILFSGWKAWELLIGTLSIASYFVIPNQNNWTNTYSILTFSGIVLFVIIVHITRKAYEFYKSYLHPIKVIRQVVGEGIFDGKTVIVLDNTHSLSDTNLLTLFSKSSGVEQAICLLKIESIDSNGYLNTIQMVPSERTLNLKKYFDEDVRRNSLFAFPVIKMSDFEKFLNIEKEALVTAEKETI